jgi:hypothetical protein
MKQQSWGDIIGSIALKIGALLIKVLVFVLWIVGSGLESLLHDLNATMKKFLFPHKN